MFNLNSKIENVIEVNDVCASWDDESTEKTLEKINLKIKPGQLYAIIGPVGAGKVFENVFAQNKSLISIEQIHFSFVSELFDSIVSR